MLISGADPPKSPGAPPENIGDAGYVAYAFFCLFGMALFVHGFSTFCAGLTSPKSSLSQLAYSLVASCLNLVQFWAFGFSIESSNSTGSATWTKFIGDLQQLFMRNVDFTDTVQIGEILLQYGFSMVPACLLASSACQRGRFIPVMVFVAATMSIVYYPAAHWCWQESGWIYRMGALDYAGGTIIHITSGFGALVYSLVLGPRMSYASSKSEDQPYSLSMVVTGTVHMMLGWIGFTGGSQVSDPAEALLSVFNTLLSAATGGFSWMILDHIVARHYVQEQTPGAGSPFSLVSFCSGVISGLVAITPGAGYVMPYAAIVFGICGGLGCNLATKLKFYLGVDDPLDTFAVHGMGGLIGTLLTGVFAMEEHRHKWQFLIQLVSAVTVAMYTLACTLIIVVAIDSIPYLSVRLSPEQEAQGPDYTEHRETAAIGIAQTGRNWYVEQSGGGLDSLDLSQLRQTNVNTSMHPGSFGQPLLQRLPLSYGTYTRGDSQLEVDPL